VPVWHSRRWRDGHDAVHIDIQVLFALDERYVINEKGSVRTAGAFPLCPDNFTETVSAVLARPGKTPAALQASVTRLHALREALHLLHAGPEP
jgi:hypothetical protein